VSSIVINALLLFGWYAPLATGFALIFGTTRIFHFAYGALYSWGAYSMVWLMIHANFPLVGAAVAGVGFSVLLAIAIFAFAYQPLLRKYGDEAQGGLFIVSLGIYIILQACLALPFGTSSANLTHHFSYSTAVRIFSSNVSVGELVTFGSGITSVALVYLLLVKTRLGLSLRAVGVNADLADSLGIDIRFVRGAALALGTAVAGVAAVTKSGSTGFVTIDIGLAAVLAGAVAAFLGGAVSYSGAVGGAAVLAIVEAVVAQQVPNWKAPVVYAVLLALILFRPHGLWASGSRRGRRFRPLRPPPSAADPSA
jgi:branched-chain amino acid transport system permease protein